MDPVEKKGVHRSASMKLGDRHSAVLFGPPGTAKTTLCESIAKRLGWYHVELSPSDFLGGGLEGIYSKVNEVFEDLQDLYGAVVLFDEMDALVSNRDGEDEYDDVSKKTAPPSENGDGSNGGVVVEEKPKTESPRQLGVTEVLLTTSMLPKLAQLHKSEKIMFFMATNYIGNFDGAIIRSGRFDLLVHMGPPRSDEKIRALRFYCRKDKRGKTDEELEEYEKKILKAEDFLRDIVKKDNVKTVLDRFTFGEMERFLYSIKIDGEGNVVDAILSFKDSQEKFLEELAVWAEKRITLSDKSVNFKSDGIIFKPSPIGRNRGKEIWKYEKEALKVSVQ